MGESATLIASTPAALSNRAPSIALAGFKPFGGSISTLTMNFLPSFCASSVGPSAADTAEADSNPMRGTECVGPGIVTVDTSDSVVPAQVSTAARIAAMCSGVVPQQPPMIRTPASAASVAND